MAVETRSGRRCPTQGWAAWRTAMVREVVAYVGSLSPADRARLPIDVPCKCTLVYYHGDRRRRDLPGMRDALYHVFERAGLVQDDSLFVAEEGATGVQRKMPYVWVRIETKFVGTL